MTDEDRKRYQWAANELLACDYGDNNRTGEIGWLVYGWRNKYAANMPHNEKPRIYGPTIDAAIDAEIARIEAAEKARLYPPHGTLERPTSSPLADLNREDDGD